MATDLRRLIRKLQQALAIQQGRHISLSTYQVYSTKAGRTCTKYILSEQRQDGEKRAYKKMLESWSLPEIVKALANELQGVQQSEISSAGENTTAASGARTKSTKKPIGQQARTKKQTEPADAISAGTKKPRTKKGIA